MKYWLKQLKVSFCNFKLCCIIRNCVLCLSEEMEDQFHNLEMQLADQLNVIKTMLLNIEDKILEQNRASQRAQRRIVGTILKQCQSPSSAKQSNRNEYVKWVFSSLCVKEMNCCCWNHSFFNTTCAVRQVWPQLDKTRIQKSLWRMKNLQMRLLRALVT